jgi:RNA-directed DNA polymerase
VVDARVNGFDFLGYHFRDTRHWPREKGVRKLKDAIRAKTRRNNGTALPCTIANLNRTLRGWFAYFQHSRPWIFQRLDRWIRQRLRSILRKRRKRRGRAGGADPLRWPNAFFAEPGLFRLAAAHASACQSSRR